MATARFDPVIRQADLSDLTAIRACAWAAYAPYVAVIGRKPAPMVADFARQIAEKTVWVAVSGPEICGFIVFYAQDNGMFLENVAIAPAWAGHGIGRRLIARCEAAAHAVGLNRVMLYTNAKMKANLSLYPHLGYRETHRAHENGFERVYFEKALEPRSEG